MFILIKWPKEKKNKNKNNKNKNKNDNNKAEKSKNEKEKLIEKILKDKEFSTGSNEFTDDSKYTDEYSDDYSEYSDYSDDSSDYSDGGYDRMKKKYTLFHRLLSDFFTSQYDKLRDYERYLTSLQKSIYSDHTFKNVMGGSSRYTCNCARDKGIAITKEPIDLTKPNSIAKSTDIKKSTKESNINK